MSLYQAAAGVADPAKFNGSMAAVDLAVLRALGSGVLSGLTVDGTGTVQPGEALIGHVVALAAATPAPGLVASATNYVYLQMPPAPAAPGADGRDAGLLVVNQSGLLPAHAVLLATITTGAGAVISGVNNAPAGRVNLAAPVQGRTLITLAPHAITVTPGVNYITGVDFSGSGTFADAAFTTLMQSSDPLLVVSEELGSKTAGKIGLSLHYRVPGSGSTTPVAVTLTGGAKGEGFTGLATTGLIGTWDALTSF